MTMRKYGMVLAFAQVLPLVAAVRLASPFTDGAVLQRGMDVPVWGWAGPGESVEVKFAGASVKSIAAADGRWECVLPPMQASREGRTLTAISTKDGKSTGTVKVADVLVGEVWYVSGQSNCELPLCGTNPHFQDARGGMTARLTRKPLIRFVKNACYSFATEPCKETLKPVEWKTFTPENLSVSGAFSAMGVYFALELYSALEIPVGVVGAYWGGTVIEAWIPREGFESDPLLAKELAWKPLDAKSFAAQGGMKGKLSIAADTHDKPYQQPTVLWNRQVAPFAPFAARGMIWYQGCSNSRDASRYSNMMHALYRGWSKAFRNPGFKLYFAQLANYGYANWNGIWEQQAKFEKEEPNAAMAIINDVGNSWDIHPSDKRTVGQRLALHALKRDYGFDIQDNSPTLKGWKIENGAFRLSFNDVEKWQLYRPDFSIGTGFEVAGPDGVFHKAELQNLVTRTNSAGKVSSRGVVTGLDLVVSSSKVPDPKSLRYLADGKEDAALFNEMDLPLGAFSVRVDAAK